MPSFMDRLRAASAVLRGNALAVRSPRVPNSGGAFASASVGGFRRGILEPIRSARTLRRFSEQDVWVRTAINRRKREIGHAKWSIMRIDDPKAEPKDSVVKTATDLFCFVNDTRVSLGWLLNMLVEDLLVLDAGVLYKEKTTGGKIAALWPIPGEEIAPDANWDGSHPKQARYFQQRDGKNVATYLNDELVYMMANPRTNSPIGLSPLEVLINTVEADLYGESFEYGLMRETAPAGMLYLGGGIPADKVEAFREQWENEIAGTRDIVILGGGGYDPETGQASTAPNWTAFARTAKDEQRREYMKWLATKVAAAFEMDLLAFNLSETVHRSIGEALQNKTDAGLMGLAAVIESFITREILWELDPTHAHGFQFMNLTPRDDLAVAKVRQLYMSMGYTFPNELRAEDGKDDVPWGEIPYPTQVQAKAYDPAEENEQQPQANDEDDVDPKKPADDVESDDEN